MAVPASVSTGTITGTFVSTTGEPKSGHVWFTPSFEEGIVAGDNVIVTPEKTIVALDTNGHFEIVLVATDDPDLVPLGFTYTVSFDIARVSLPSFSMSLASGATVDLADVFPAA